jgi:hypothetical protein
MQPWPKGPVTMTLWSQWQEPQTPRRRRHSVLFLKEQARRKTKKKPRRTRKIRKVTTISRPHPNSNDKGQGDDGKANLESKFDDANEDKQGGKDKTIEIDKTKKKRRKAKKKNRKQRNKNSKRTQRKMRKKTPEDKEDKMDIDLYSLLDLHNWGYKKHTNEWKKISEGIMKGSKNLVADDAGYIKDAIEDIIKEMGLNMDKMDKDEWVQVFVKTKDIANHKITNHKNPKWSSYPKGLFSKSIFDGNKLVSTDITKIWAAAYTSFRALNKRSHMQIQAHSTIYREYHEKFPQPFLLHPSIEVLFALWESFLHWLGAHQELITLSS